MSRHRNCASESMPRTLSDKIGPEIKAARCPLPLIDYTLEGLLIETLGRARMADTKIFGYRGVPGGGGSGHQRRWRKTQTVHEGRPNLLRAAQQTSLVARTTAMTEKRSVDTEHMFRLMSKTRLHMAMWQGPREGMAGLRKDTRIHVRVQHDQKCLHFR